MSASDPTHPLQILLQERGPSTYGSPLSRGRRSYLVGYRANTPFDDALRAAFEDEDVSSLSLILSRGPTGRSRRTDVAPEHRQSHNECGGRRPIESTALVRLACAVKQACQDARMSGTVASIETRASWVAATASLVVMAVAFGAPYVAVVALKPMAADLGGARAVPSLCYSLVWFGTAAGGVALGPLADRVGLRWTAVFGSFMVAAGLALASRSGPTGLYIGHGVLVGVLGLGGINAPVYVYVSRWFDRHRGTALALISSGLYIAGAAWPPLFEPIIERFGWRETMMIFAVLQAVIVVPTALLFFAPPPRPALEPALQGIGAPERRSVLGLPPNLVLGLIAAASFLCCVPMAMPQSHLVAFCSDLGIAPERGAAALSVLLGTAFLARQFWGFVCDRVGALRTLVASSGCMAAAMAALLFTQSEAGLFMVSAFFGFGFSGLIPAYVVAIRELFPASEAGWRVPVMMLLSGSGMAVGGWLAGALYDHFGFYGAAFAAGLAANLVNFAILAFLAARPALRAEVVPI
jgi:MFS family permease